MNEEFKKQQAKDAATIAELRGLISRVLRGEHREDYYEDMCKALEASE